MLSSVFSFDFFAFFMFIVYNSYMFYLIFLDMWKLVNKIMLLLVYLVLCAWAFELLLIIGAFIKDAKYKDIYIFSIIILITLVFSFLLRKLFFDTKPKFKDWKYVWKDWRVYEGDWNKKYWADWKWKLTWSDWSYYEWEFKNGQVFWKWKKVVSNWTIFEWTWVNWFLEWKWKIVWEDGGVYEWEFKKGKPDWMWIIKMKNWYYYEWEFSDWKRIWKFKKEVLPGWGFLGWEFIYWNSGFNGVWKEMLPNWFVSEWTFRDWNLYWEWKTTFPDWTVYIWNYENWLFNWKWKKIFQNWEYFEWIWVNWELNYATRYYFSDWSYYEWEFKNWDWSWKWTYVTKKWEKYSTEFPYEIINVLIYWLNSKIKEIQWNLNYILKAEKEKNDEKNMYLKILKSWTNMQKEIAKLSLEEDEKSEKLWNSLKMDSSVENLLNFYKGSIKFIEEEEKKYRNIANKYHINFSKKKTLSYSYSQFFFRLDWCCINEIAWGKAFVKIFQFLSSKNIFDFVTKREEKDKERIILIDEFSEKYKDYIQSCLDWREYEKKFWKRNFKPDKNND